MNWGEPGNVDADGNVGAVDIRHACRSLGRLALLRARLATRTLRFAIAQTDVLSA